MHSAQCKKAVTTPTIIYTHPVFNLFAVGKPPFNHRGNHRETTRNKKFIMTSKNARFTIKDSREPNLTSFAGKIVIVGLCILVLGLLTAVIVLALQGSNKKQDEENDGADGIPFTTSDQSCTGNNCGATGTIAEFDFVVTWELSMLYTDDEDVQHNVTMDDNGGLSYTVESDGVKTDISVSPKDVMTLDGVQRKYIAINGQYPGPTIEVAKGTTVYVHVTNQLLSEAITLHWHGLEMRGTQWSDGAPYVTQCPIAPGQKFTYRFVADTAGTFWYHSHMKLQRMDGLYGALVVKDPSSPESTYERSLLVTDWLHMDAPTLSTSIFGGDEPIATYKPIPDRYSSYLDSEVENFPHDSLLVNGRGRFHNKAPLHVTEVQNDGQVRLRIYNMGYDNMFEVSIDGHNMTVVEVDACEIEPITVHAVYLAIGERVTVLVDTDQTPGNYWIRYNGIHLAESPFGTSILRYETAADDAEPTSSKRECSITSPCVSFNCPFSSATGRICIPMDQAVSKSKYEPEISRIRSSTIAHETFLAYSFMAGDSINGKVLLLSSSHMYQADWSGVQCDETECDQGCECTHMQKLPYQSSVQIVVMHTVLKHFVHTFHLHGHRFAVVKVVYPPKQADGNITRQNDIICTNDFCNDARWNDPSQGVFNVTHRPPLKDTVLVPLGGYVVLRVFTDNPGYWMAHCHQSVHLWEGMAMVFEVKPEDAKPNIPAGFPTCGDFTLKP